MRIRGIGRLKRLVSRVIAPFRSEVVILLYHRVFEASSDPQRLCVSPKHFAEHLEHLRRCYKVMSLGELASAMKEKRLPKRAIVITFDDGYVDNLLNAKPLLERYEIPATVFVATGYLGKEFWWDELERLVLLSPSLPKELTIVSNKQRYSWYLGEGQNVDYGKWHVECPEDPSPRHRAYRELHRLLRPLGEEEREAVFAQLRAQAKNVGNGRPGSRAMTAEEVCKLADGGLIVVGAHTNTHPVLAVQPVEIQRKEIIESKRQLETILKRPVTTFAYPYGGHGDIGQDAVRLARGAGYEVACANFPSPVTRQSDPFFLPRYLVRDWDGEEFARRLRKCFHDSP